MAYFVATITLNSQVLINVSRETEHGCICHDVPPRSEGGQLQIPTDHMLPTARLFPCNGLHHWPLQALPSVDVDLCRFGTAGLQAYSAHFCYYTPPLKF